MSLMAAKKKLLMAQKKVPETIQSLPAMTNNGAPAGHLATASSETSGYQAYRAFDQLLTPESGGWASNNTSSGWVQRALPSPIIVLAYRVIHGAGLTLSLMPNVLSLQGSNNGSSFVTLDSRSGLSWSGGESKQFEIAAPAAYSFYRLNVSVTSGAIVLLGELELLQPTS